MLAFSLREIHREIDVIRGEFWVPNAYATSSLLTIADGNVFAINASETHVAALPHISDLLIVMGHGEGAHIRFQDSVLCSSDRSFQKNGNCTEGVYCKRAAGSGLDARYLMNITGKILVLLSCNSFSTAGETYPNNFNLVASAIKNFELVIATPWALKYSQSDLVWVKRAICSSQTGREALIKINFIFATRENSWPFVGIGEASTKLVHGGKLADFTCVTTDEEGLYLERDLAETGLSYYSVPRGLILSGQISSNTLPQKNHAALARLTAAITVAKSAEEKFKYIRDIFYSFISSYFDESTLAMCSLELASLERKIRTLKCIISNCIETGIFSECVQFQLTGLQSTLRRMFARIARNAEHFIFDDHEFGDSIIDEYASVPRSMPNNSRNGVCSTCGNDVICSARHDSLNSNIDYLFDECPVCGTLSFFYGEGSRPKLIFASTGKILSIRLRSRMRKNEWAISFVEFRDKGNRGNDWRKIFLRPDKKKLIIDKSKLSPDQQSVRFIVLTCEGWKYTRAVHHNVRT